MCSYDVYVVCLFVCVILCFALPNDIALEAESKLPIFVWCVRVGVCARVVCAFVCANVPLCACARLLKMHVLVYVLV